jgi:DNA-binding transcriptional ArsR family regulator
MSKDLKKFERVLKGVANHRRIEILFLLKDNAELSLADICDKLKLNIKTGSEHVRRLALSGLVIKRYEGNTVRHKITSRSQSILKFLRILE